MQNKLYDGVLINLLQKGPAEGALSDLAREFMDPDSVSMRYKESVKNFSIENFGKNGTYTSGPDKHRWLFHRHYRPRVYKIFGYFDVAILQLCDSVEIIPSLSTLPSISATQNIFGLRTVTSRPGTHDGEPVRSGNIELCSPLLPYLLICNVKVHPLIQMIFGKDLQALLNVFFHRDLDEVEILQQAMDGANGGDLLTLAVLDTYGWNDLTFLIHGSRFDRMFDFVLNRICTLRLPALLEEPSPALPRKVIETVRMRIENLERYLQVYGLPRLTEEGMLHGISLFSYTDTVPGMDFRFGERLRQAPSLEGGDRAAIDSYLSDAKHTLKRSIRHHIYDGKYVERIDEDKLDPVIDRIARDMVDDQAGCFSAFSLRPGSDQAFQRILVEAFSEGTIDPRPDVVFGQYDALFCRFAGRSQTPAAALSGLQKIIQIREPPPEQDAFAGFSDIVLTSKTAISYPSSSLKQGDIGLDPFDTLRRSFCKIFKFKPEAPGDAPAALAVYCRQIRMPKPLQISLENTLEPFYSFLQDSNLFCQYVDLYSPLLLIMQQVQRAAADRAAERRLVPERLADELRQFNRAFKARFRSSYLRSESTETTLEFQAHTVTPLDMIQCIIDCFTELFVGFDRIAGFPLISDSPHPCVHPGKIFSVELNTFHLLYPETLLVLFHELGHLYLRYRRPARRDLVAESDSAGSCLWSMLDFKDKRTPARWRAFTNRMWPEVENGSVKWRGVADLAEELLCDLMLLAGVCHNDWELFLWYYLTHIETLHGYLPPEALDDDEDQVKLYRELLLHLFLVHAFWSKARSARPEEWAEELSFRQFRTFADKVRGQSKKLRQFCARHAAHELDASTWRLVERLVGGDDTLAPNAADGIVRFQSNQEFWSDSVTEVDRHPALPTMFMSVVFEYYRRILEDLVAISIQSYEDRKLYELTRGVKIDFQLLHRGESTVAELTDLLALLAWDHSLDSESYLEQLRGAPSDGLGAEISGSSTEPRDNDPEPPQEDTPETFQDAYASGYRRITRALYALVKYFHRENTMKAEEFRYLYRDPESGRPERFSDGQSDVIESPCFAERAGPLPIVVDSRGVFFCRSTEARQQAFQYRNAVIRELADIHYKLRPVKMAEMARITNAYGDELDRLSTSDLSDSSY